MLKDILSLISYLFVCIHFLLPVDHDLDLVVSGRCTLSSTHLSRLCLYEGVNLFQNLGEYPDSAGHPAWFMT